MQTSVEQLLEDQLMTQGDARREAKRIYAAGEFPDGLIPVATAWPPNSWGGAEKGWTVTYVPAPN